LKSIIREVTGVTFGVQIMRRLYTNYAWETWGNSSISIQHSSYILAHNVGTSHTYRFNEADAPPMNDPGMANNGPEDEDMMPLAQLAVQDSNAQILALKEAIRSAVTALQRVL
jgi:hypothetical protein